MDSVKECQQKQEELCCQEEELVVATNLQFPTRSLSKSDFALLKTKGIKIFGKSLKFCYTFGSFEGIELGVTAFKKGGNAVARNYFRRIVKEVFRKTKKSLPIGLKLQVVPNTSLDKISYLDVVLDFTQNLCTSIQNKKEPSKP